MRRLRLAVAGPVILMLLGGPSGVVVAQDEESESPDDGPVGGYVMGTFVADEDCEEVGDAEDLDVPGIHQWRGLLIECQVTAGDPRVSGTLLLDLSGQSFDDSGEIHWGTARLDGAEGSWDCSFSGSSDPYPTGGVGLLYLMVCRGTGEVEDLTFVSYMGIDGVEGFGNGFNIDGFIYEGDPPPPPWGPSPFPA